jgi:glycosyltransferase involved in cell wall biosynthesis
MIVGGAQENTLLTILDHVSKGHEVVLVTGPSPGPEGKLLDKVGAEGIEIVTSPHLVRELSPFKDFAAYRGLRRVFRGMKPDVVHTHSSKAGVVGRAAAWAENVPFVCHTVHGPPFHRYEKSWRNFLYKVAERWAAKRCHKIFAVADAMVRQYVDAGIAPESKFMTVYSGMRVEDYADAAPIPRSELGIPDGAPVVVTVARLFPLKGYEYLLDAAEIISRELPETRFLVVGDGILRAEIELESKRRGLNFVFAGLVAPSEVGRYVTASDVMMHLSLREGLPRSVVQALAAGVPPVAFELDGAPEVVLPGKTGFLAPAEDAEAAARGALDILRDDALRAKMSESGRKLAMDMFGWRKMGDVLEREYLEGSGISRDPETKS